MDTYCTQCTVSSCPDQTIPTLVVFELFGIKCKSSLSTVTSNKITSQPFGHGCRDRISTHHFSRFTSQSIRAPLNSGRNCFFLQKTSLHSPFIRFASQPTHMCSSNLSVLASRRKTSLAASRNSLDQCCEISCEKLALAKACKKIREI